MTVARSTGAAAGCPGVPGLLSAGMLAAKAVMES